MSDKPKIPKRLQRDRDKDAKQAKKEFEKAKHDGVSTDQIIAEGAHVEKLGLPTTWEHSDSPIKIRGKNTIVEPTDQQVATFALSQRRQICGQCKHFDLEKGREEILRQRLPERLTKEDEWNPDHLGAPLDTFGLCAESGDTLCSAMGEACDHYTALAKWR